MTADNKWDGEFPTQMTAEAALAEARQVVEDLDTIGEIMVALSRGPDEVYPNYFDVLGHFIQERAMRAREAARRVKA